MNKEQFKRLWGYVYRSWVLYAISAFIICGLIDKNKLSFKLVNELRQPINYLVLLSRGEVPLDKENLYVQLRFYKELNKIKSIDADVHSMMGFCYFYLGNIDKSLAEYQKAADLNPEFFWHQYNLGIINLRLKNYNTANQFFSVALAKQPSYTYSWLQHSSIYRNQYVLENDWQSRGEARLTDVPKMQKDGLERGYQLANFLYGITNKIIEFNEDKRSQANLNSMLNNVDLHPLIF